MAASLVNDGSASAKLNTGRPGGAQFQPDGAVGILDGVVSIAQARNGDSLSGETVAVWSEPTNLTTRSIEPALGTFMSDPEAGVYDTGQDPLPTAGLAHENTVGIAAQELPSVYA